jgi:hypothetical protein
MGLVNLPGTSSVMNMAYGEGLAKSAVGILEHDTSKKDMAISKMIAFIVCFIFSPPAVYFTLPVALCLGIIYIDII